MGQVTFTAHLVPSIANEEEFRPRMDENSSRMNIEGPVFRKLNSIRADASRILSGVTITADNFKYHYLAVYSIHDPTAPPLLGT